MSQPDPEAINLGDVPPGEEGATTGQNRASQRASYIDGSEPLFSMYVDMTAEQDRRMANSWKGDADGILVFTGLFSAAVAALAAVSVGDLRPSSQDISAYYLSQIYQLLADANASPVIIPPNLPSPIVRFSTPTYAIWVNSLWFLSLTMSLTCALLATLLQQWARRYVENTQPRYSPDKRARIRAFFSDGVDKLHLPWAVEALPTLLHLSLFLFFFGLLIFLFNIDHSVFSAVAWWVGLCTAIYACITFMPLFRHDSPYYAPLSTSAWYFVSGTLCLLFRLLLRFPFLNNLLYIRFSDWEDCYCRWFLLGPGKVAEETARKPSLETDGRISPALAPSSPIPPLSSLKNVTIPQSGLPIATHTHPSTSVTVSSLVGPQAASILDPQVASNVAMLDAHKGSQDSTAPAEPDPYPEKVPPRSP